MPIVHAHRRKEKVSIDTGVGHIEFEKDADGRLVADVDGEALDVLLSIPEAFALLDAPASGQVLTNGDKQIDLATLDKDALVEVAISVGLTPHHKWSAATLRAKILEAVGE